MNSKIEWMVDTFLNSANYAPHVLLTLTPPSWYALNLKALIKMSKVCWTYSFDMKHLDLHLKSLIRIALVDYVLKPAVYTVSPPTNFLWKPKIIHRGLKLDGAIGQGKICNSLKSENFSKSFLSHIGKNKIKF